MERSAGSHMQIVVTKLRGRCAVARYPIVAGTVLLTEEPLACVPDASSTLEGLHTTRGRYKLNQFEIDLQRRAAMLGGPGFRTAILAARLLLVRARASVPIDAYDQLIFHMQSDSSKQEENLLASAEIVYRLVLLSHSADDRLSSPITIDDCVIALRKLSSNAFSIVDDDGSPCGVGVYSQASAINHSCAPTAVQRFTSQGVLEIRARHPIGAREEITISYIDPTYPRWRRNRELRLYGFDCACRRCSLAEATEGYCCPACPRGIVQWSASRTRALYRRWLDGRPVQETAAAPGGLVLPLHADVAHALAFCSDKSPPAEPSDLQCNLCGHKCSLTSLLPRIATLADNVVALQSLASDARLADRLPEALALCQQLLPRGHVAYMTCVTAVAEFARLRGLLLPHALAELAESTARCNFVADIVHVPTIALFADVLEELVGAAHGRDPRLRPQQHQACWHQAVRLRALLPEMRRSARLLLPPGHALAQRLQALQHWASTS